MSEIISAEGVSQAVGNIASGVTTAFYWILILLVIAVLVIFAWMFFRYKHKVRVRKVVKDGRAILIDDKARVFKDKDGAVWWMFRKTKIKVAEPSSDALEINNKGKIVAEGFLLNDGNFIWRNNDFDLKELEKLKTTEVYHGKYDALTSQERALYAKELRDSESYKKKKLSELLMMALPFITVIIVIVLTFVLIGEAIEPARQLGVEIRGASDSIKEAMQIVKDVVQNRETSWLESQNMTRVVAPN
jgi:hypothetical protein